MNFGYFDDEHHEFVITDPHTPVKWINFIGTPVFGGFIDHTGGASIHAGDPGQNPITQYDSQSPDANFNGETLYLRMRSQDGSLIFSPFYAPGQIPMNHFECSVGQGYSRWRTEVDGLCCEVTVFVPADAPVEIRDICITNLRSDSVEVDAVPVVEFAHADASSKPGVPGGEAQIRQCCAQTHDGCTVLLQSSARESGRQVKYFAASLQASSIEVERRDFLPQNGRKNGRHLPELAGVGPDSHPAWRDKRITGLLLHLGTIPPGESARFATLLGQAANLQEAKPILQHYKQPEHVDAAFASLARPHSEAWVGLAMSAARSL